MWTKPLAGFGSALAPSGAGPKPGTNFQHEVLVAIARTASKTCASAILVQNPPENALDGPTWTHIKQGSIQQVSGNLDPRAKRASTGRPENENATQRDGALDRCRPAAFEHSRQIRVSSPSRVAVSRLESASRGRCLTFRVAVQSRGLTSRIGASSRRELRPHTSGVPGSRATSRATRSPGGGASPSRSGRTTKCPAFRGSTVNDTRTAWWCTRAVSF